MITRGSATGGSSAELELLVRPTAVGFFPGFPGSTPYHSHPHQEEALKVLQGIMNYTVNGKMGTAVSGEELTLPAGAHKCAKECVTWMLMDILPRACSQTSRL